MSNHLFACDDGALYDTRNPAWSRLAPLRQTFRRHYREIRTSAEFKATLRAGAFAWPGGYPLYFIMSDGGALCFACGRKELRYILPAIASRANDGWRAIACDINYEDQECYCDNCSKQIESAYGYD